MGQRGNVERDADLPAAKAVSANATSSIGARQPTLSGAGPAGFGAAHHAEEELLPARAEEKRPAAPDRSRIAPQGSAPSARHSAQSELDLPGLAPRQHGSGPEKSPAQSRRLPAAPDDLPAVVESDLPAALRPKTMASARDEDLPATLESDLPAALAPRKPSRSDATASIARSPASAHDARPLAQRVPDDLLLPELKPNYAPPASVPPPFELASTSVAPPSSAIKSNPPDVDSFEFDLPSPIQAQKGLPELETSVGRRSLTEPGGFELPEIVSGLPAIAQSNIGLPSVPGRQDGSKRTLPGPSSAPPSPNTQNVGLTAPSSPILEIDLGLDFPTGDGEAARQPSSATARGGFGDFGGSLPPALGMTPPSQPSVDLNVNLGSLELPLEPTSFPSRSPSPSSVPRLPMSREAVGPAQYGEVSLESSDQDLPVETEAASPRHSASGEVLEFGSLQQVTSPKTTGPALTVDAIGPSKPATLASPTLSTPMARDRTLERKRQRGKFVVWGVLAASVISGSALTLLPDIGPFGAHFVLDQLRRKKDDALLQRLVETGRQVLASDDFSAVGKVMAALDASSRERERYRPLKAYAAYFSYAVELRHGNQPQSRARAKVILDEMSDKYDLQYLGLAGAARAAAEGNIAKARRAIASELSRDGRNADAQAVSAEISMLERRPADALQTWLAVAKLEQSARAVYGLARAHFELGQFDAATANAEQAMVRNPNHVGARLLLARIALEKRGELDAAERRIGEALALQGHQSVSDFVQAKTLTGDLQLLRSRISLAEAAYQEALEKDPRSATALRGLGETLYRAGRYSESLARFEAGLQADPDDVQVAIGVAKAQLALERVREAGELLTRLRQSNPKHYSVNYWYAKAEEAAGNREEAEKGYAVAIDVGGTNPTVVEAYVSMALLKNQQGRREEAQKVLAAAQERLPRMPKIHEAIGQLALSEGRYSAAVDQFREALALDPNDLGIKFRLGVALRKNREFETASKIFDEVAAVDRDYPGLALERGQLFEASGQTEEALRAFESALAKAPTDPDLMLRVGCGKVAAGRSQQAEQLLKKVLEQRPTSAETHHCLGRAQLLEGSNLALALRTLERAVELDPHRAEYHLYVGWAANEAGRVALAEQALKKALELDQGLGDAYWQRGILRYRQGAVKDAVADLTRALELRPGRYEAHAALADAYFDLGYEPKALEQWRQATVAQPDNATFRFRFGKLLQAAHRDGEAKPELEAALELAAKQAISPRWAWEAHHLLARAIGAHPTAVKHWQAFLELAPRDNAYRDEAKQALSKLGQPWDKD